MLSADPAPPGIRGETPAHHWEGLGRPRQGKTEYQSVRVGGAKYSVGDAALIEGDEGPAHLWLGSIRRLCAFGLPPRERGRR